MHTSQRRLLDEVRKANEEPTPTTTTATTTATTTTTTTTTKSQFHYAREVAVVEEQVLGALWVALGAVGCNPVAEEVPHRRAPRVQQAVQLRRVVGVERQQPLHRRVPARGW